MKTSSLCSPFFKDIGVPDSQTVNSSSMAFHKFKTKPPFHSSTLKTYYSKNVFVECSVFEFLASYFHFSRLFKLNKFSISVTVLLLSVHPSNSLDVFNSSFCLLFGLVMMWFFRHNMLHTMILNLKSKHKGWSLEQNIDSPVPLYFISFSKESTSVSSSKIRKNVLTITMNHFL